MGRHKIKEGTPCKHGHPYKRDKHGCWFCRKERERARDARRRKEAKPPGWIVARGIEFVWAARRALRRRGAGARPPLEALVELWDEQGGRCAITRLPIEGAPQLDRIVPVALGGTNAIDNLQWTSKMANNAKNAHSVNEVRVWILAAADALRSEG